MVKLKCRRCGGEVDSDEKARKCRHCNELFPFECAVCAKHLRPPIPEYPIERYYNDDGEPLCADHYQRACPECGKWFRADENPGFFLCTDCTRRHEIEGAPHANDDADDDKSNFDDATYDDADEPRARSNSKAGCAGVFALALMTIAALPWLRFLWS